ncbi:MAG: hypothetical protein AAGB93_03115 [Planctomycetota bacterium]
MLRPLPFAALFAGLFPAVTSAQIPTALLREGDTVSVGGQSQTVQQIRQTTASACAGFACSVRSSGPLGTVDLAWGALTGGAPGVLRAESTVSGLQQLDFNAFFELSGSGVGYSARSRDVVTGQIGIRGAWLDGDVIARTGTPALGGRFWADVDEVGTTLDGRRWFRGRMSDAPGGPVTRRGLFVEDDFGVIQAVVLTGMTLPDLPAPLTGGGVQPTSRFSSLRGRWISPVNVQLTAGNDGAMTTDGRGLLLGGSLVQESVPIPGSVGGIGDRWDDFTWCGINEAGDWFFCGDTSNTSGAQNEYLCRNDGIWLREGDAVSGGNLRGGVIAAGINASSEVAYVWDVEAPGGEIAETLFLEDRVVARVGDAIDWDGDGALDPTDTIDRFLQGTLSVASSGDLFVAAVVDRSGNAVDAYLRFPRELGERYCAANANFSGGPGSISAHGSPFASANDLTLRCASLPQLSFGFFLVSRDAGFAANPGGSAGNLCLGGAIGRFQQAIQNSGSAAVIELQVDLTALPQPNGTAAVVSGDTWRFSTWFRDRDPMGNPTSNFSDAVAVTFR